jgi:hypothetical protein
MRSCHRGYLEGGNAGADVARESPGESAPDQQYARNGKGRGHTSVTAYSRDIVEDSRMDFKPISTIPKFKETTKRNKE